MMQSDDWDLQHKSKYNQRGPFDHVCKKVKNLNMKVEAENPEVEVEVENLEMAGTSSSNT